MKNYVQPGNTITLPAPYPVTSGGGMLVGALFGVASYDAAPGDATETLVVGVVELNKVGGQAWAVGDRIYWDDANRQATNVATGNTLIGAATAAVAGGPEDTNGRVRLNGTV